MSLNGPAPFTFLTNWAAGSCSFPAGIERFFLIKHEYYLIYCLLACSSSAPYCYC